MCDAQFVQMDHRSVGIQFGELVEGKEKTMLDRKTKIKVIMKTPGGPEVFEKHFPGGTKDPKMKLAMGMTLEGVAKLSPEMFPPEVIDAMEADLMKLDDPRDKK